LAAELHVELVAADRSVWSGEATLVIARTTSGDIGVMPGHQPLLGVLESGPVTIRTSEGATVVAAVHGGFISSRRSPSWRTRSTPSVPSARWSVPSRTRTAPPSVAPRSGCAR